MLGVDIIERMHPIHLIKHYLMASYCYYIDNGSPMTDAAYDRLCVRLDQVFDQVEHPHKHLIQRAHLKAGTGYYLREQNYPRMVVHAANEYERLCVTGEMTKMLEPHLMPASTSATRRIARRTPPPPAPVPAVKTVARVVRRPAPTAPPEPQPAVRRIVRRPTK